MLASKINLKTLTQIAVLAGAVWLTKAARAEEINVIPDGTVIQMPIDNVYSAGPISFGSTLKVTWTSQSSNSVFGFELGYGFGINGTWDGLVMAGTNDGKSAMTFQLSSPVNAIGGFINYSFGSYYGPTISPPVIAVYDSMGNLIQGDTLTFRTDGSSNSGEFVGFSDTTPISEFTLSGARIGITGLTVGSYASPVPEPSTWAMILLGFCGLAGGAIRGSTRYGTTGRLRAAFSHRASISQNAPISL